MKKILFIKSFLLISLFVTAQSFPDVQSYNTIYTRKGTPVQGTRYYGLSIYDYYSAMNYMQQNYPNATILENPTSEYNCYSYAFHLSEGNAQRVWINPSTTTSAPNLSNYWTDGSFIRVCNESDGDRAHYYAGGHAAVTTSSISGQYVSKWGANSLVIHAPTYCPYDTAREYYASTKITGDVSNLCVGTRTFSVKNIPGATYSWTYSGYLTATSGTNTNQLTVQKNGSARGTGWVEVQISIPCAGTSATSRIEFPVGAPIAINQTSQGCNGAYQIWMLQANPTSHGSGWYWTVGYVGTNSQITIYNPSSPGTQVSVKGGGTVNLNYTDACGIARQDGITAYSSCYGGYGYSLSVSPNPVKNNINLRILGEESIKSTEESSARAPQKQIESKGKTIISLYELNTKSLVRQWKQNESTNKNYNLNVNGLRKGVYILQVERGNQTMVTKIIIK